MLSKRDFDLSLVLFNDCYSQLGNKKSKNLTKIDDKTSITTNYIRKVLSI